MKVYKLEVMVIDHDEVGEEGIVVELQNAHYPNDCIDPVVKSIQGVDIGEWRDDHPLNHAATADEAYRKLFE